MKWRKSVPGADPPSASTPPVAAAASEVAAEVAKSRRGRQTAWDMVRSLGLLAVIVAVTLVFVPGLLHPSKSQRFPAADYSGEVTGFRQVTGAAALVPSPVPSGWHANSASLAHKRNSADLRIGWVTPNNEFASIDEGFAQPAGFVTSLLGRHGTTATGSTSIAGARWQTLTSSHGEPAITRTMHGITIVITGSASTNQLRQLAALLH